MTDFIKINVKNPATGSTKLNDSSFNETENKLKNLLSKIEKPKEEDISLSNFNSVVGNPEEFEIDLENLILPPEDWRKIFREASEIDIKKMAASIYQYGLLHRITVWQKDDENFIVLGGMTRLAAFKYLFEITEDEKWKKIPAKVYSQDQIDEIDAKRIFIVSNTDSKQMSAKNISFAYYNLVKLEKERAFYGSGIFSRDSAAVLAGVSPTTFNNYLKLMELYPPLLEEIDKNNFQVMAAYEIAFLEPNLQRYIYNKKYYLNLKRKTAKIIKEQAETAEDIDKIISNQNSETKVFKYNVETKNKLPSNFEILPVFVNSFYRDDVLKIFTEAITSSKLPNEIKNELLKNF